jgi:putative ABC transport system permease protein
MRREGRVGLEGSSGRGQSELSTRRRGMSFVGLVLHNLRVRWVRTFLTALAVAISVMAVVTLGVVTESLKSSAAEVLAAGKSDFTVAQKSVAEVLSSVVTSTQLSKIASTRGVKSAVGVLVGLTKLDASHPVFLEIGIDPASLHPFGVEVVSGRSFGATATNEIMLGWQAAQDLRKRVGDELSIDAKSYRIVGLYSTGQVFGDSASMFPLSTLQANERKPGTVTLAAVQVEPGSSVAAVRRSIEQANPNLATVRLASEYGRIDRNLVFLSAAQTGARIISLVIGVIIVMNTMLLSFVERIREFGVLRAIGWSRIRLLGLVFGEALGISLLGAAVGVAFSFVLTSGLQYVSALRGVLNPTFDAGVFWTALYSAFAIGLMAALYPSGRAALLRPGVALRNE